MENHRKQLSGCDNTASDAGLTGRCRGAAAGVLEPERTEWYPLDAVLVSELRYVRKQAGEDVELKLTRNERGTEITALR